MGQAIKGPPALLIMLYFQVLCNSKIYAFLFIKSSDLLNWDYIYSSCKEVRIVVFLLSVESLKEKWEWVQAVLEVLGEPHYPFVYCNLILHENLTILDMKEASRLNHVKELGLWRMPWTFFKIKNYTSNFPLALGIPDQRCLEMFFCVYSQTCL